MQRIPSGWDLLLCVRMLWMFRRRLQLQKKREFVLKVTVVKCQTGRLKSWPSFVFFIIESKWRHFNVGIFFLEMWTLKSNHPQLFLPTKKWRPQHLEKTGTCNYSFDPFSSPTWPKLLLRFVLTRPAEIPFSTREAKSKITSEGTTGAPKSQQEFGKEFWHLQHYQENH